MGPMWSHMSASLFSLSPSLPYTAKEKDERRRKGGDGRSDSERRAVGGKTEGIGEASDRRKDGGRRQRWRRAFIIAHAGGETHELRIDVANASSASVLSHAVHRNAGLPTLTLEEQFATVALPPKHLLFVESVRRCGVDMDDVLCAVFPIGWFSGELLRAPAAGLDAGGGPRQGGRKRRVGGRGSRGRMLVDRRGMMADGEGSAIGGGAATQG